MVTDIVFNAAATLPIAPPPYFAFPNSEENGDKKPVTEKVIMPNIEGAIITAKGASNGTVKSNIVAAVQAATGLSIDKIQVFEMK